MNLFEGQLMHDAVTAKLGAQEFTLSEDVLRMRPGLKRFVGRPLVIGIRPEDLSMGTNDTHQGVHLGQSRTGRSARL